MTLAVVFVRFTFLEVLVVGLWKGKALAESLPKVGGGSAAEIFLLAIILTVALIPFFAFRELSRAVGGGVLGGLLWKSRAQMAGKSHSQDSASA